MPAPEVTHLKIERMTLVGAQMTVRPNTKIEAKFNPGDVTFNKGVQIASHEIPGLDSPVLQFVRGQNETLAFDLFFDTSDAGTPVTVLTDPFYALVKMEGTTHAPPVCKISWSTGFPGSGLAHTDWDSQTRQAFIGIAESVKQHFTHFKPDGTPLRATLTLSFREYKRLDLQLHELNLESADQTSVHLFRQGETLSSVAAGEYHDPTAWRHIALENGIDDPLAVSAGSLLAVPPIA